MKYNKKAFFISGKYASSREEKTENEEEKLLEILFDIFAKELENKKDKKGIIRIKLDFGQANRLVNEKFESLARNYCIYFASVNNITSEYELIWDYQTYYDALNFQEEIIPDKYKALAKKAILDGAELPLKYKLRILQVALDKLKECKKEYEKEIEKKKLFKKN